MKPAANIPQRHSTFGAPRLLVSVVICLACLRPAHLEGQTHNPDPKFRRFPDSEILAYADVEVITQDRQGFLWFGTLGAGLIRHDGYQFKVYRHDVQDERSLGYNSVVALHEDRRGVLWVGLNRGGLDRYDRDTDSFRHFRPGSASGVPYGSVRVIFEDAAGVLWVGGSGGLSRLDPGKESFLTYTNRPNDTGSLANNIVNTIFEDRETGLLWAGTDGGISLLDRNTGRFTHLKFDDRDPSSLSHNGVMDICQDRAGVIWVSTGHGLNRFDPKTKSFVRYDHESSNPGSLGNAGVQCVHEDRAGNFWVPTTGGGLDLLDRATGTFSHYTNSASDAYSIVNDGLRSVFEDRTGVLWLGSINGACWVSGGREKFATHRQFSGESSPGDNAVTALHADKTGALWVGTGQGLNRFENQILVQHYAAGDDPRQLRAPNISAIAEDAQGTLWVSSQAVLHRFDGQDFTRFEHNPGDPASISAGSILAICPAPGGLWISKQGRRLDYFDGRTFSHFQMTRDNSTEPASFTTALVLDKSGKVWIGTQDMGLACFNPADGRFTTFLPEPANPHNDLFNRIFVALPAADGTFWIGSNTGLRRFDPATGKFTTFYGRQDGLPDDGVVAIVEDDDHHLWLATAAGLSRFDPQSRTIHNYDRLDGLLSEQFRPGMSARTADGRIFFGSRSRLTAFHPREVKENPHVPPVVLTAFELFGRPAAIGAKDSPLRKAINVTDTLTFHHRQSMIGFEFAALDYTTPQKNRYAYKMEGFDADWNYTGAAKRFATYTRLPPGHYVFRVRGSNNDGLWNDAGASVAIVVLPPWWATWWFRGLMGGLLIGGILGGHKWRITALKRRQHVLELQVAERTRSLATQRAQLEASNKELEAFSYSVSHDLRTPLRTIDGFSRVLLEDYADKLEDEGKGSLDRILVASHRMERLIDDMLALARIARTDLHRAPVDLGALASSVASELHAAQPQQRVEFVATPGLQVAADPNLLRIALQNLLSNAWKFTSKHPAAHVELGVTRGNGEPVFFVRDDGAGFDMAFAEKLFGAFQRLHAATDFQGTGVGLAIVQRVIQRHGGRIWAESAVEQGATFYFTLPDQER